MNAAGWTVLSVPFYEYYRLGLMTAKASPTTGILFALIIIKPLLPSCCLSDAASFSILCAEVVLWLLKSLFRVIEACYALLATGAVPVSNASKDGHRGEPPAAG